MYHPAQAISQDEIFTDHPAERQAHVMVTIMNAMQTQLPPIPHQQKNPAMQFPWRVPQWHLPMVH